MAYSIDIRPDLGAVQIRAYGQGSRTEGLQAFAEAIEKANAAGLRSLLFDILELEFVPSNADASVFSGRLAALGGPGLRIAFVAPPGAAFGVARMVGTLTELLGARVSVFETHDDAEAWLRLPA